MKSITIVTTEMCRNEFKGMSIMQIRDELEQRGLDRHLPIQLSSTEIALITPKGILMQVRAADSGKLGVWGGAIQEGETPEKCAIREVKEETGLEVSEESLEYVGTDDHVHQYANGDKASYTAFRYVIRMNYVPDLVLDAESSGKAVLIKESDERVLSHQQKWIGQLTSSEYNK